jgi:hypothetical protein
MQDGKYEGRRRIVSGFLPPSVLQLRGGEILIRNLGVSARSQKRGAGHGEGPRNHTFSWLQVLQDFGCLLPQPKQRVESVPTSHDLTMLPDERESVADVASNIRATPITDVDCRPT